MSIEISSGLAWALAGLFALHVVLSAIDIALRVQIMQLEREIEGRTER